MRRFKFGAWGGWQGLVLVGLAFAWLLVAAVGRAQAQPQSITVVTDDDYPPYAFRDPSGQMQGLLVDQWTLWSQRTGIEVKMQSMDWAKAQKTMLAGQADVIDAMFKTEDRQALYDFSVPYARIEVPVFFHQSISGIVDTPSLKGFTVGVKEGDACVEILQRQGIDTLHTYNSYSAITAAAAVGEVRVFCMDQPPALYLLSQLGMESKFRRSMPLYTGEFHRAVRKGNGAMLVLVEDGFSRITEAERREMEVKWFGDGLGNDAESGLLRYGGWVLLGLAGVAAVVGLLAAWNLMLRRRVAARTAALTRSLAALEDAQRESEQTLAKLNATLGAIPDLMFEVDSEGRFFDYHAAHSDLLLAPPEVFLGRSVHEALPAPVAQNVLAALRQAATKGRSTGTQICLELPQGESWFELSIARKPGNTPEADRFIVLSRDITDRKRAEMALLHSEQSFRHFFEAGLVGMAISLPDRSCAMFNQRLAEMMGRNGRDMYRQTWAEMTHPDDLQAEEALLAAVQAGEREGYTLDKRFLKPDGSVVHAALAVRCERDEQGQAVRFFVIAEDITQRELAKAELASHRDQLEHLVQERSRELVSARDTAEAASRAKSEFLSRMSHELRTPLNAIQGFSQLLELDQQLQPQSQRHVQEIRGASHHLLSLINDVLDLAQVESGKIGLTPEALHVGDLLNDVLTLLQPLAQRRAVKFQVQTEPDLLMRADRTRLKQVLLNLVSNAIKYNREGGGVSLVATEVADDKVRITVRDTGNGITLEQQRQLFEPFNRLGAEYGTVEGSGIGLSICRRLVDAMGGRIGVDSAPGEGSEFWLELPRAEAAELRPMVAEPVRPVVAQPLNLRRATVLCVEDNEVNLLLMEQIVQRHPPLKLVTAATAAEGLALARQVLPELMLLDIGLPDMDGHALLALLRQDPLTRAIPTVAVTANAMPADAERALKAGFDDFLPKPIDLALFDAMLQRILGLPEAEPDLFSQH